MALCAQHIRHCPPRPPFYCGYPDIETIYAWDMYFESLLLSSVGFPAYYMKNGVDLFLHAQRADGFIPRQISYGEKADLWGPPKMHQPFLCQTALLVYQNTSNADWLECRFNGLSRYLDHWLIDRDPRGAGLSVWQDCGHSGMDDHYERAGKLLGDDAHAEQNFCEGVDLNSYLVRECQALAVIAEVLNRSAEAARLQTTAQARRQAMQRWLWDEQRGMYFDFHAREKRPIFVGYIGTFAPMWAEVASEIQARRLVLEHLLNPEQFWRPWPLPAMSADEPGYCTGGLPGTPPGRCSWRAHSWAPTNYYVFQALRQYGFAAEATELAERSMELFARGAFSEFYCTETGVGTGRKPFGGWTGLMMLMELELDLEINPTLLTAENAAASVMGKWIERSSL